MNVYLVGVKIKQTKREMQILKKNQFNLKQLTPPVPHC